MRKSRNILFIALLAFIISGTATEFLYQNDTIGLNWKTAGLLMVVTRFGFPMLLGVWGSIYLEDISKLSFIFICRKQLPKVVLAALFWWIVVSLLILNNDYSSELDLDTFLECLHLALEEPYYMQFYQSVIMLTLFAPLLGKILNDQHMCHYAMVISFLLCMANQALEQTPYINVVSELTKQINWNFVTSNTFYLFGSAYLLKHKRYWFVDLILISAGLFSTFIMYFLTAKISNGSDIDSLWLDNNSFFAAIQFLGALTIVILISDRTYWKRSILLETVEKCVFISIAMFTVISNIVTESIAIEEMPVFLGFPIQTLIVFVAIIVVANLLNWLVPQINIPVVGNAIIRVRRTIE